MLSSMRVVEGGRGNIEGKVEDQAPPTMGTLVQNATTNDESTGIIIIIGIPPVQPKLYVTVVEWIIPLTPTTVDKKLPFAN